MQYLGIRGAMHLWLASFGCAWRMRFSVLLCVLLPHVAIAAVPEPPGGLPPDPVTRKVMLLVQDPFVAPSGGGRKIRLHQYRSTWLDPIVATQGIHEEIRQSSGGYLNYAIAEQHVLDEFPVLMDGSQHTEQSYKACLERTGPCFAWDMRVDYAKLLGRFDACGKIRRGEIDDVVLYGGPEFNYDEFAWKIPGDRVPYQVPSNPWIYSIRKYNLEDCGRSYTVMGYNYETGIDNALHSFGHRIESALVMTVGRGEWDACHGASDFDAFTCHDGRNLVDSTAIPGCGNIHFPPHSIYDGNGQPMGYIYDVATPVNHGCYSWPAYRGAAAIVAREGCAAWECTQLGYLRWWMHALPRRQGYTIDGNLRNWWAYVVDYDQAVSVLPYAPDLTPATLSVSPAHPVSTQAVTLSARVSNTGRTESPPFQVRWNVRSSDHQYESPLLTHQAIGEGAIVGDERTGYTLILPRGTYVAQFTIDPGRSILETDKNDNVQWLRFTVE